MVTKKQRQIYAAKMIFYKDQHILTRLKICFNWAEMIFYRAGALAAQTTTRQKRDQSIAMIMILIVVVFTSCNVVRIVVNVYEVRHVMILIVVVFNLYEVSIAMIMILIVIVFTSCNVVRIVVNVYEVSIVMILVLVVVVFNSWSEMLLIPQN